MVATLKNKVTASKFFWYFLLFATLGLSILSGLAYLALTTGADIPTRIITFASHNNNLFYSNVTCFLVLLLTAAYLHRRQNKPWFYIPATALFVLFVNIGYLVLNAEFFTLQETYDIGNSGFSVNRLFSIMLSVVGILMAAVVWVSVVLLKRRD